MGTALIVQVALLRTEKVSGVHALRDSRIFPERKPSVSVALHQVLNIRNMRGYVSMVGDLFHVGHINLVRSVRDLGYTVVVGVHSDEEVEGYKRTPVMTLDERVAAVQACKYVTDVIAGAPTIIDDKFIKEHNIDIVPHGRPRIICRGDV